MTTLKMHTPNLVDSNIDRIAELFPNCITEKPKTDEQGNVLKDASGQAILERGIDFELLKQELSHSVIDGSQERYRLDWVGKREAIVTANSPIAKTLRPVREESVDFDTTGNLFIEGDNLEALKLLQESYLGKVKMIYIDPPYNTGNDFIYNDDFAADTAEFFERSGQVDADGNRLVANTERNGRFHSDWLSMMYSRLKLARNLLADDGVLFISINDKEVQNLKSVLNEVFGSSNFLATLIWDKNHSAQAGIFKVYHEYIMVFCKDNNLIGTPTTTKEGEVFEAGAMKRISNRHPATDFTFPAGTEFRAPDNTEFKDEWGDVEKVKLLSGRMVAKNGKLVEDVQLRAGFTQKNQMQQFFYGDKETLVDSRGQKIINFYFTNSGKIKIVKERSVETPQTTLNIYSNQGTISTVLAELFKLSETPLNNPKPVEMLKDFIKWFVNSNDIIMDFFAGSSTTAHAVMQLNAEDGGNRKFIMVQIPEPTDPKSEAHKAGYPTIAEISKERIRRAGAKIKADNADKEGINELDTGFRVLKIDTTNMNDIYYHPQDYSQDLLGQLENNIKPDRSDEDLLFQFMLDTGVPLSLPIERTQINGHTIYQVGGNSLIASLDYIDANMVNDIAALNPLKFITSERAIATDSDKTNIVERFKQLSPHTDVRFI